MTDTELIQYVELRIGGGEHRTGIMRAMILAVSVLALADLAKLLISSSDSLSEKLTVSLTNQTWANSTFPAPSNMLFFGQKDSTRLSIGNTLAYQVKDRKKLDMSSGQTNIYYALDGKTFYIKSSTATSGNDLNISYYKIPTLADIDEELRNVFIDLVVSRLVPQPAKKNE